MSWRADGWRVAAVAAFAVAAAVIFAWQTKLGFILDEWDFLLGRRGSDPDVFLLPHHEHIAIAPIVIYKVLLAVFGMESAQPWHVLSLVMFLATIALVFTWLRERVGEWLALAGVLPLLVFGAAWDNVLWPFQIGFTGSILGGIGALMALERGSRRADGVACGLLTLSMAFSSLGIAFAAAAAVAVVTAPGWRRRAWIVVGPAALFGLWYLGWGREAESAVSWSNLATAPGYVLDGFASSLSSLFGLATPRDEIATTPFDWGRWLLVGAVGLAAWRLLTLRRIPRAVLIPLAGGVTFWFLTAINANLFRLPTTSRYQLIGAIFVLMIAAELLRGVRPNRAAAAICVAVGLAAAASNAELLHTNWAIFRGVSESTRAEFAAEEIARDTIDPSFVLDGVAEPVQVFGDAEMYLSASDEFGSPAYTEAELLNAPEAAREAADSTLVAALGIATASAVPPGRGCETATAPVSVTLGSPGATVVAQDGEVSLSLLRFADVNGAAIGSVPAGEARLIEIPGDRSEQPWRLQLGGSGRIAVCPL